MWWRCLIVKLKMISSYLSVGNRRPPNLWKKKSWFKCLHVINWYKIGKLINSIWGSSQKRCFHLETIKCSIISFFSQILFSIPETATNDGPIPNNDYRFLSAQCCTLTYSSNTFGTWKVHLKPKEEWQCSVFGDNFKSLPQLFQLGNLKTCNFTAWQVYNFFSSICCPTFFLLFFNLTIWQLKKG